VLINALAVSFENAVWKIFSKPHFVFLQQSCSHASREFGNKIAVEVI
jgi:hypothetical protein